VKPGQKLLKMAQEKKLPQSNALIPRHHLDVNSKQSVFFPEIANGRAIFMQVKGLNENRVWEGGPDPAFPLFFHGNPASRTQIKDSSSSSVNRIFTYSIRSDKVHPHPLGA